MKQTEGTGTESPGLGETTAADDEPNLGYVSPIGTEVRGADGERLGQVVATWPSYVYVETSPGAADGYWVPVAEFTGTEGAALILSVTRHEAERRGWKERPAAGPEENQ